MTNQSGARLPFPENYLDDYVSKIFLPIKRGECVTSVWTGSSGRRVASRFIVDHPDFFADHIPERGKYLLVYVEPLDLTEESQAGYLRLIGHSFVKAYKQKKDLDYDLIKNHVAIFDDEQAAYAKLLEALKEVIAQATNNGVEVVMFLGEIDELGFINSIFCNNIRSIWNQFNGSLHYVFLIKDTRFFFKKSYFSEDLGYLFFQNVFYMPVSKNNEDYLIESIQDKTSYKLSPQMKNLVSEMCDGHPYFIKLALETLAKRDTPKNPLSVDSAKQILRENYEIRAASDRMIEVLTDSMKAVLLECSTKKVTKIANDEQSQALLSLGLLKTDIHGSFIPFCELFQDAILKRSLPSVSVTEIQKKIYYDQQLNAILVSGKSVEDKLTRQEYELLSHFLKEPDKLFSRDDIAAAIWGKNSFEKYSDWAIDQLVSKIRKKLGQLGIGDNSISTIRGRGYKFNPE